MRCKCNNEMVLINSISNGNYWVCKSCGSVQPNP